jgi:predicted O-methyltransferase YrrM
MRMVPLRHFSFTQATETGANMEIKSLLKQNPIVRIYKIVTNLVRSRSIKRTLKHLENTRYLMGIQLKETLESLQRELPQSDKDLIKRIEVERKRLLGNNEPLNDGSFGEGGLYDKNTSISLVCSKGCKPPKLLMLYLLTRTIKPQTVIELGTNVGISSAYIGMALKVNAQNGTITTLEASPYRLRLAKEVHHNLGIDNISYVEGLFQDTLSASLTDLGSVDLAFIDGDHKYQSTLDYFEEILRFSNPDTVFVFDDIRWSDEMERAWSRIQSDDRLGIKVDLFKIGICVRGQQEVSRQFVFGAGEATILFTEKKL